MVGDATNWPMGLAVAPAINLKTLSAAKDPAGIHRDQLAASPFEALTLIPSLAFLAKRVWFGVRTAKGRFGKSAELGGGRATAWIQFMGGVSERQFGSELPLNNCNYTPISVELTVIILESEWWTN